MVSELELTLDDGRTLRVHDSAAVPGAPTVVWHHGSPHTGALLPPLLSAAADRGIRLVSYARPGYGGSAVLPGRDVAAAARDVEQVAASLGLDGFAVMGASGGGPHALACAALLPDRVTAVVSLAGLAPFSAEPWWFAGMRSDAALRAATAGRDARSRHAETEVFDPDTFTDADWAALSGAWASLGQDAERAGEAGSDGLVDDDVAFVSPWGFDLARVTAPTLVVHGGHDRMVPPAHADRLVRDLRDATAWRRPDDGHVSVLHAYPAALDWVLARQGG